MLPGLQDETYFLLIEVPKDEIINGVYERTYQGAGSIVETR